MSPLAYQAVLHSITVLTITFQIYMFYLIKFQSPKNMANYKWYLNYFTACDLLFSIIMGACLQPDPSGFLMTFRVYGISSWIGPSAEIITTAGLFAAGAQIFISQDFCLLYRYSAILENTRLHEIFVTPRMKFFLFSVGQVISIGIFCFVYNLLVPPEIFFDETFETQRLAPLRLILEPGEFVLMPIVDSKFTRIFMVLVLLFFFTSEVFCIFLVYLILSTLRQASRTFSKNTYRLHYQLTLLLAIQLAIPLFLIIIPISLRWGAFLITGQEVFAVNHFRMALVTLYGLCNSIFTVIFVTPYRIFTYNQFIFPVVSLLAKILRLKGWEPRRQSLTWVSGIRRDAHIRTVAKTSVFLSD